MLDNMISGYEITNLVNGKIYHGITIRDVVQRVEYEELGGSNANAHFLNAVKKYGRENFVWRVTGVFETLEGFDGALYDECYRIVSSKSFLPTFGYNKAIYDSNRGPELEKLRAAGLKAYWETPGNRELQAELGRVKLASPAFREKLSEGRLAYWQRPGVKQKHSLLMKKRMETPNPKRLANCIFNQIGRGMMRELGLRPRDYKGKKQYIGSGQHMKTNKLAQQGARDRMALKNSDPVFVERMTRARKCQKIGSRMMRELGLLYRDGSQPHFYKSEEKRRNFSQSSAERNNRPEVKAALRKSSSQYANRPDVKLRVSFNARGYAWMRWLNLQPRQAA